RSPKTLSTRQRRRALAPADHPLNLLPASLRHHPRRASGLRRVRACRRAVAHPAHDPLRDARGTEHVVGYVETPFVGIDRRAAGAVTIRGDVLGLGRYAESVEIQAFHAAERSTGNAPAHAVIGEVGQRMPQGGELPVEHGEDPWLARMEYEIVETVIAMHDGRFVSGRDVRGQPFDQ